MIITELTLKRLHWLAGQLDEEDFTNMFDKQMGEHIYYKFREVFADNIIAIWGYLDEGNKKIFLEYINSGGMLRRYKHGDS